MLLTGVTVGAVIWKSRKKEEHAGDSGPMRQSIADLESRMYALESSEIRTASASVVEPLKPQPDHSEALASLRATVHKYDSRLSELETKVGDHDAKLKEIPTLTQVISTMEQMLAGTMTGLDQKIADQVRSIEVLKTTVAQSDELMERVLDSIYSLQSHVADADKPEVPVSV